MIKGKRSTTEHTGEFAHDYMLITMKKDTTIKVAIFDLIDNSIEAAEKRNRIRNCKINIYLEDEKFVIEDNSGGLEPDKISKLINIGYRTKSTGFGVGMKRAIIKLGEKVEIHSNNKIKSVLLSLDIKKSKEGKLKWKEKELDEDKDREHGVKLVIDNLDKDFIKHLTAKNKINIINHISKRYRKYLEKGLVINFMGCEAEKYKVNAVEERLSSTYTILTGVEVQIKIYSNIQQDEKSGWDIFVNDKCILERDKSEGIGWKKINDEKSKGYSYSRFLGEVFITGIDVRDIPVNSTKDKIDFDSEIMQKIIRYMYSFLLENKELYRKNDVSIQFERSIDEVDILKEYFEVSKASEVGRRSFDKVYGEAKKRIR